MVAPTPMAIAISNPKPLAISFSGSSHKLTQDQKIDIEFYVLTQANVAEAYDTFAIFNCKGLQFNTDSKSKKVLAVKRANAVCDYIDKMFPSEITISYGDSTKLRTNSGKVHLGAYFFQE